MLYKFGIVILLTSTSLCITLALTGHPYMAFILGFFMLCLVSSKDK